MEIHLDQNEVTKALSLYATNKQLAPSKVKAVITWDSASYNFPLNILEILTHCEIKGVLVIPDKDEPPTV
jgi:hypothetical protein